VTGPSSDSFSFAPLGLKDLPLLDAWLAAEHVSAWFGPPANAEQDPLGEQDAVSRFVVVLDGRPIGLIQTYRWSDFPENAAAVGAKVGEIGMDYLIGELDQIGHGIGPVLIEAFLEQHASHRGDVIAVRVDVSEANHRSWRCLEKAGFRRDREGVLLPGQTGPHYVYVRDTDSAAGVDPATVAQVARVARAAPLRAGMSCRTIAIDGPGGAGKSALAVAAARELGGAPVLHTDDFAGWDHQFDWYLRLLEQVLKPLAHGSPARYQRYDWGMRKLAEWHQVEPGDFLIIEGVGASRQTLRPYLSACVWVETDRAERLRRGLRRDGPDSLPLWEEWMRGEDEYIAAERPDASADLVVSGEAKR
jgi:uridine kinase/RimJ/RimL family protein N-acetyltransferase